jgi:hypothetical protein
VTGSTIFGSSLSTSTHQFTGSVNITGSLAVVTTGTEFQVTSTGVNLGNALTDSHVISGSLRINPNGLFVSSSGNVGIGELSPASPLSVTATSTAAAVSTGVAYIVNNGTGNGLQVTTSGTAGTSFIFKARSSGVDRFWVGDLGDVGIGNTSFASTRLTITGKSNTSSDFSFVANNSSNGNLFLIRNDGNVGIGTNPNYNLDIYSATSPATIGLKSDGTYNSVVRDYTSTTTSTLDITTERTDGGGFNFLLLVSSTLVASGSNRNYYTFAVQGRGTTATATQLSNVSAGTSSRTAIAVSFPSNGVIRLTLTGGESCQIKVTAIGHGSL